MSRRDTSDADYLEFIEESIRLVASYTQHGYEQFKSDVGNQDQVVRRMEVIADAAAHLSEELHQRHPGIPWRLISDFRNAVAHGYLEVDLDLVWNAVEELSELQRVVGEELARARALEKGRDFDVAQYRREQAERERGREDDDDDVPSL